MPDWWSATKSGRTVSCQFNAAPMHDAIAWLNRYERFWSEALRRLAGFLEEEDSCPSNQPSNQASPSSGGSKAPPAKVFAAWTDPEKIKRWMGPAESSRRRGRKATLASAAVIVS